MTERSSLYETDIVAWSREQADALRRLAESREARTNGLDWENLIDEVESVGRSQVKAVRSRLLRIFVHLIKMVSDPDAPSHQHWRGEVAALQGGAAGDFTPSMRQFLDLDALWRQGLREAAARLDAYGSRPARSLPERCPFALDALIADDFDPTSILETLGRAMIRRDALRDPQH